jgi:hypothetical protein
MVESYLRANKMFIDHNQVIVFHFLSADSLAYG